MQYLHLFTTFDELLLHNYPNVMCSALGLIIYKELIIDEPVGGSSVYSVVITSVALGPFLAPLGY